MRLISFASAAYVKFQSAPDREVGRCNNGRMDLVGNGGFNPRPTVRSGDAFSITGWERRRRVSIRARP